MPEGSDLQNAVGDIREAVHDIFTHLFLLRVILASSKASKPEQTTKSKFSGGINDDESFL